MPRCPLQASSSFSCEIRSLVFVHPSKLPSRHDEQPQKQRIWAGHCSTGAKLIAPTTTHTSSLPSATDRVRPDEYGNSQRVTIQDQAMMAAQRKATRRRNARKPPLCRLFHNIFFVAIQAHVTNAILRQSSPIAELTRLSHPKKTLEKAEKQLGKWGTDVSRHPGPRQLPSLRLLRAEPPTLP